MCVNSRSYEGGFNFNLVQIKYATLVSYTALSALCAFSRKEILEKLFYGQI